jgi:hypothetical protein
MPNLINRDPPGRLSCVHAFLRSLWYRFDGDSFTGIKAKHVVGAQQNPIEYCKCAREYSRGTILVTGNRRYCPFLRAGSSKSCCYLVNSNLLDSQKSKAVGEAIQALEALGLCSRKLGALDRLEYAKLTESGIEIAKLDFFEQSAKQYYVNEIVNYGPAVGFLHVLDMLEKSEVKHSEISKHMGRPNNNDEVTLSNGCELVLNDGDTKDAKTRTAGALQAWLTYAGYVRPTFKESSDSIIEADSYFCDRKNRLGYDRVFQDRKRIVGFFDNRPLVRRPLSYNSYIKGLGAAREYSQRSDSGVQTENLALKEFGQKVKDRRLLLMFSYSLASAKSKAINLRKLAISSNFDNSPFVVDADTHEKVLVDSEVSFLTIAGAPFLRSKRDYEVIHPRVNVECDRLKKENPFLTPLMEKIVSSQGVFV